MPARDLPAPAPTAPGLLSYRSAARVSTPRRAGRMAAAGAALWALSALPAAGLELTLPVDCVPGESCHIQNHVDRDPSPGAADHTCGPLTYDGHKGTDFRLPDRAAMRAGVAVLAAAPGRVIGTRDAMPDVAQGGGGAPGVAGRECGNGVMLRHEGGWTTQYCHMARGSIAVAKGETVTRGRPLGRIGLSGATEFAHLHFAVRDPEGRIVDPFDGRQMDHLCSLPERESLWVEAPAYAGGGALAAGFAAGVPEYGAVKDGRAGRARLPEEAPAIVFWAHFYGLREGDVIALRLTGPDGAVLVEDAHRMERTRAQQFRAAGRRGNGAWAAGVYRGEAALLRGEAVHARIAASVVVGR